MPRDHWVLTSPRALQAWCAGSYLFLAAVVGEKVVQRTGGHFVYALDDPYIHLALASQIARGHYGINPGEPSSPSSSLLWPFLLAPFANHSWGAMVPLALNLAFGFGACWLIASFVRQWAFPAEEYSLAAFLRALTVAVLLMLIGSVVGLAFLGMEHVLQVLLSIACATGVIQAIYGEEPSWWSVAAAVLAPSVRYENLALTMVLCIALAARGKRGRAFVLLGASVLPLLGFAVFLHSRGLPVLPISVLVKGAVYEQHASLAHRFVDALRASMRNVAGNDLRWPVLALLFALVGTIWTEKDRVRRVILGGVLLLGLGQLFIGRFGWFNRYEVYAVVFLSMVLLATTGRYVSARLSFLYVMGFLLLAGPGFRSVLRTQEASHEIYSQQYQTARFAHDYYKGNIAVNDLGLVSYGRPSGQYVLDLEGLGSLEAARQTTKTRAWMHDVVLRHDVGLVAIYPGLYPVPADWVPVAQMCGEQEALVVLGGPSVAFYSTRPAETDRIQQEFAVFAPTLPAGVTMKVGQELGCPAPVQENFSAP